MDAPIRRSTCYGISTASHYLSFSPFLLSPTLLIQKKDELIRGSTCYGINLIIPPTSNSFVMVAESEEEQRDWIAALNEVQGLSVSSSERFSKSPALSVSVCLSLSCRPQRSPGPQRVLLREIQ